MIAGRRLDVEFSAAAGEVLAVLGPNGAGKSTVLHVIAGLVRPDEGVVRLGDRMLTDTAAGVDVATHERRVGLLLQDPLLFPHLNVVDNVDFGMRSRPKKLRTWRSARRGAGDGAAPAARGGRPPARRLQPAPAFGRSGPAGCDRAGAGG